MADELAGLPIGQRIQRIRERTGKTRPVVAGMLGRSVSWLKAIEGGRLRPPSVDELIRIAGVLGVTSFSELIGDGIDPVTLDQRTTLDVVPAIREAIETPLLSAGDHPAPEPASLHERVEHAWRVWHASVRPRSDAGLLLPGLITDSRRAARMLDGDAARHANMALAGAYALSEQVLAWVADAPLLWLAADRCMEAAMRADDPETIAAASWVLGNVWRSTGREEDAVQLVQDACRLLEPRLDGDSDTARALWGSCQLHGAITAARLGREGDALRGVDLAGEMATKMPGDYMHPWTLFASPNVALTGVSVQVDLVKNKSALEYASKVDPDSIGSVDRRARLWLETARAYSGAKDYTGALGVMKRAVAVSEECMRCHPLARGIAGELVTSGGSLIHSEARRYGGPGWGLATCERGLP
ncbi:MAG TPA: helix-turn-helix transcriptional regulator, partial [Pseudonocardiaceae bacterium]